MINWEKVREEGRVVSRIEKLVVLVAVQGSQWRVLKQQRYDLIYVLKDHIDCSVQRALGRGQELGSHLKNRYYSPGKRRWWQGLGDSSGSGKE